VSGVHFYPVDFERYITLKINKFDEEVVLAFNLILYISERHKMKLLLYPSKFANSFCRVFYIV
jgi:hypothetical protein